MQRPGPFAQRQGSQRLLVSDGRAVRAEPQRPAPPHLLAHGAQRMGDQRTDRTGYADGRRTEPQRPGSFPHRRRKLRLPALGPHVGHHLHGYQPLQQNSHRDQETRRSDGRGPLRAYRGQRPLLPRLLLRPHHDPLRRPRHGSRRYGHGFRTGPRKRLPAGPHRYVDRPARHPQGVRRRCSPAARILHGR